MLNPKPRDRIVHVIVRDADDRRRAGYPNSGRTVYRVVVRTCQLYDTDDERRDRLRFDDIYSKYGKGRNDEKTLTIFVYAFGNYSVTATANNRRGPRNFVTGIFSFRNKKKKKKKTRRYNYVESRLLV